MDFYTFYYDYIVFSKREKEEKKARQKKDNSRNKDLKIYLGISGVGFFMLICSVIMAIMNNKDNFAQILLWMGLAIIVCAAIYLAKKLDKEVRTEDFVKEARERSQERHKKFCQFLIRNGINPHDKEQIRAFIAYAEKEKKRKTPFFIFRSGSSFATIVLSAFVSSITRLIEIDFSLLLTLCAELICCGFVAAGIFNTCKDMFYPQGKWQDELIDNLEQVLLFPPKTESN